MHILLVLKYNFALTALPFGSPNMCISNFAIASSKFLTPLGTSDMPRILYGIARAALKIQKPNYKDRYVSAGQPLR